MSVGADEEERLQVLLSALFLREDAAAEGLVLRASAEWITEWLGLDPRDHFGAHALRHLVAVQLAPRAAISYEPTNPRPRWRLVEEYLRDLVRLDDAERTRVARVIATVLDRASAGRGPRLVDPDWTASCAICRLTFRVEPMSVATKDPYKPVWQASEELCRAEVDHVVPIASLGEHAVRNLQVVCRACNLAKGAGLIVDPDSEIRFAGVDVARVPRIHLLRLLQWLIKRGPEACAVCDDRKSELTMRPLHRSGPIARANLELRCYACV